MVALHPSLLVFSLLFGSFCPLLKKPRLCASAFVCSSFSLALFLFFPFSPRRKGREGVSARKVLGDCQPLARHSLAAEAGFFGAAVDSTPRYLSGLPRLTFPAFLHSLLLKEFCPSATPMSIMAVLWLSPPPVCRVLLLHSLSRNRSDLCKTSSNALESDLLPALPFHKANFHQHCIWHFFLTFRRCSVNL